MNCDTCLRYWQDVQETKLLLTQAQFERDRKRLIHLITDETRSLEEAVALAEERHELALDRWHAHWGTHHQ
jgi:hypothetical protein